MSLYYFTSLDNTKGEEGHVIDEGAVGRCSVTVLLMREEYGGLRPLVMTFGQLCLFVRYFSFDIHGVGPYS